MTMPGSPSGSLALEGVEAAAGHRAGHLGDLALERRIDPLDA